MKEEAIKLGLVAQRQRTLKRRRERHAERLAKAEAALKTIDSQLEQLATQEAELEAAVKRKARS